MLFNSFAFLFMFLPLVLFVATRKHVLGQKLLAWITLCSFVFYAFAGHVWFLLPMLFTTVLDFLIAPCIAHASSLRKKNALLYISLVCNLGLLFYFKYSSLFLNTFGLQSLALILPAGISFYTFQTLSYIIDVYRGHAEPESNFWKFAGFVSFFPHLVAGPLTRHNQLIPALERIAKEGIRPRWEEGVYLFSIGLSKKVLIADRIANRIDPMILNMEQGDAITAWLSMLGYSMQIYFDFSGYSDMAIGLARLFNIDLPQNFNNPYQAKNPSDFWTRWHITLSQWLRDYLYISLGGNRNGAWNTQRNLMITMVLGGLWHGANWTFALWGFYHGTWLILYHLLRKRWDETPQVLQTLVTFLVVSVGWIFFRADNTSLAFHWLSLLVSPANAFEQGVLISGAMVGIALCLTQIRFTASHSTALRSIHPFKQLLLAALTVFAILWMNHSSRFLYFQF